MEVTSSAPQPPQPPDVPEVDVLTAHTRQRAGALLIDVRRDDEWANGHAPGAVLMPLEALDPGTVPVERAVLVICRSGRRSAEASRRLLDAGRDATNVGGGMIAWQAAGLTVVTDPSGDIP